MTQADVSVYFPQYMYESILKVANDNPDFKYTVTTEPYPELAYWRTLNDSDKVSNFVAFVAIAVSVIPTAMISFLIIERIRNLKHMQSVSGMSLAGYWIANMLTDIIKVLIPITVLFIFAVIAK